MQETQTNTDLSAYHGPYLERSGVAAKNLAETLVSEPRGPLSDTQKQYFFEFKASMLATEIDGGVTLEDAL